MKSSNLLRPTLLQLVTAVALALGMGNVQAAGVVGTGTPESCTEAALDAALAAGGLVTFDCGTAPVTLVMNVGKTISQDTTIDGGHLITLTAPNQTALQVDLGITFTARNLVLDGNSVQRTRAIRNNGGTVSVINCTLSHHSASPGGAIYNGEEGALFIQDSTFSSNQAPIPVTPGTGYGGAIYSSGTLTVRNSTFSGNDAFEFGGAIYMLGTQLTVINSTLVNNTAGDGGAIMNEGSESSRVLITNSTIAGNAAISIRGGVSGPATLRNSIVANNSNGNCSGGIIDAGNNLQFPGTSCGASIPLLAPLASNGGVTQTMALLPGSPAIDAGNNATCPATDQRGVPRVDGDGNGSVVCDIGAYEFAPGALPSDDYTDLWWNPDTAGLVLNIHQNPAGVAFAVWYTYDIDHKDMWLTLQGAWVAPDTFAGTLYRTTGPAIGGPSDPALVTLFPVGSGILSFTDADNGIFSYSVSGVAYSTPITRFLF
jgi:predicted outer membrane repeat protein